MRRRAVRTGRRAAPVRIVWVLAAVVSRRLFALSQLTIVILLCRRRPRDVRAPKSENPFRSETPVARVDLRVSVSGPVTHDRRRPRVRQAFRATALNLISRRKTFELRSVRFRGRLAVVFHVPTSQWGNSAVSGSFFHIFNFSKRFSFSPLPFGNKLWIFASLVSTCSVRCGNYSKLSNSTPIVVERPKNYRYLWFCRFQKQIMESVHDNID